MKEAAYILFSIMYAIGRVFPARINRYFCVMTHDGSEDSSVGVVVRKLKEKYPDSVFSYVKKSDKSRAGLIRLIFVKSVEMARAKTILLDNEFLPLAYVRLREGVKVVQLWHGTGTIKKFGHDINEGKMLKLVRAADEKITHLIVNSDYTAELYKRAFGVGSDKVYVTGIPRTDVLFDAGIRKRDTDSFFREHRELKGKNLILYAPTFRDDETENPRIALDLDEWVRETDADTVLMLRLHPYVSEAFNGEALAKYEGRVADMSGYADVNTLMFVSSALITDYSSIIFEYILLDRPVYFYAYDREQFEKGGRGFYEDYESYVPGPVAYDTAGLIDAVRGEDAYGEKRKRFKEKSYKYTDGRSAERLVGILR